MFVKENPDRKKNKLNIRHSNNVLNIVIKFEKNNLQMLQYITTLTQELPYNTLTTVVPLKSTKILSQLICRVN